MSASPGKARGGRARWLYGALVLLAAIDLAAGSAGMMHGHAGPENLPLFGLAAGVAGAALVAGLAKLILAPLLTRKEGPHA